VLYFLSKQIVFVDQNKQQYFFVARFRWDGLFDVTESDKFDERKDFILVLDSKVPYRRKFKFDNKKQVNRATLMAASEGAFPFDMDEFYVALGVQNQERYVFALNKEFLATLAVPENYKAVLVSDADNNAIKQALMEWMSKGNGYDFLGGQSFFKPFRWLLLAICLLVVLTFSGAYWTWSLHSFNEARFNKGQIERLREQALPLLKKQMMLSHMKAALGAFHELSQMKAPLAIGVLGSILDKIPKGVNIVEIKFKDDLLEISGWGKNIQKEWLDKLDIKFKEVVINELPERDHFLLRLDVSDKKLRV
jgi:hypothetical protein